MKQSFLKKVINEYSVGETLGDFQGFLIENRNKVCESYVTEEDPFNGNDPAEELALYINNDGKTYETATLPTEKKLAQHHKAGRYDQNKAVKLFFNVVNFGAQRYMQEILKMPAFEQDLKKVFPRDALVRAAKQLEAEARGEFEIGNYPD